MSDHSDDYEVGYAKPPKSTRFKKGQSGNPKGRPKGATGVKASLKRELASQITIRERGRETKLSKAEVLAKSLTTDALKGDAKARLEILKLDDELFGESQAGQESQIQPAAPEPVDFAILRHFLLDQDTTESGGDDDDC